MRGLDLTDATVVKVHEAVNTPLFELLWGPDGAETVATLSALVTRSLLSSWGSGGENKKVKKHLFLFWFKEFCVGKQKAFNLIKKENN